MNSISQSQLEAFRQVTFRLEAAGRLASPADAVAYVNERGFVFFWPIKAAPFPSLWAAVAGDRTVANEHDDPGHITWGWKDDLLDKRQWYYASVLRGKNTCISLALAPTFYALTENFGEPEEDYQQRYQAGQMTREARQVYEALLFHGPLDTVRLRREARLSSRAGKSAFDRALVWLQREFMVLPVGVAQAGAWRYSHVYDCVHRFYPELPAAARSISRKAARQELAERYFLAMGAATGQACGRLFQWKPGELASTLAALLAAGKLAPVSIEGEKGEAYAVPALLG